MRHLYMVLEIKGFHVLPVVFPGAANKHKPHYVYFKKHEGSASDGRSLFLFNVPIETEVAILKRVFQTVALGATVEAYLESRLTDSLEDVWLDLTQLTSGIDVAVDADDEQRAKLPRNCGIVRFVDKLAFLLAFSLLKKLSASQKAVSWPLDGPLGPHFLVDKYRKRFLDPAQLSDSVSQALVDFDNAERESMEQLQQQALLVDEDGFTMVVGSHRKTKAGILGRQKLAATVEVTKAQNKMKKKEKEDFYRFQLREKKKQEMNELLSKFKQDQERVRLMKEKKRFRPY